MIMSAWYSSAHLPNSVVLPINPSALRSTPCFAFLNFAARADTSAHLEDGHYCGNVLTMADAAEPACRRGVGGFGGSRRVVSLAEFFPYA
ncbi:hypothetical protein EVAR_83557_1 [Eumeta japonica]|uniref:Uncharacterized protein n=1 Tax=Eumeta variegata TaxID=151549 RepID=A0A4C1TAS8_EUMVA|nr:hypothetical protein EVAR_83557_1 [Eumeta japonica]